MISFAQRTTLKETVVQQQHITRNFDVKLTPQAPSPAIEAAKLGRQALDKQFHGDLNAHSLGEMLESMTEVEGSAGYVAIERITGTMDRGTPQLAVQVVPDSGTGGQHVYTFDFTLP
ncbi:MAG: DUF3224 domain-containing protein [Rhodoferax sp.]